MGHIQTGNIYVDANVCQLGGFENTLLGYRSRLHTRIAEGGHLESIDVVMFGRCGLVTQVVALAIVYMIISKLHNPINMQGVRYSATGL